MNTCTKCLGGTREHMTWAILQPRCDHVVSSPLTGHWVPDVGGQQVPDGRCHKHERGEQSVSRRLQHHPHPNTQRSSVWSEFLTLTSSIHRSPVTLSANNMHFIRQQLGKVWLEHKSLKHVTEAKIWIIHRAACPDNALFYLFFTFVGIVFYYPSICFYFITTSRVVCGPKCVAVCWLFVGAKSKTICSGHGE